MPMAVTHRTLTGSEDFLQICRDTRSVMRARRNGSLIPERNCRGLASPSPGRPAGEPAKHMHRDVGDRRLSWIVDEAGDRSGILRLRRPDAINLGRSSIRLRLIWWEIHSGCHASAFERLADIDQ
jgi:hypothetical protein